MKGLVLILFCSLLSAQVFGQIRVVNPVHELGDVYEKGGLVKTTFRLQNPYLTDTIRIIDITPSCGCTAILTNDTLILPQSTIDLVVAYDPLGRLGLFVKSIEISTRTGLVEENKLFVKIVGNVIAERQDVENPLKSRQDLKLSEYGVVPIDFYPITAYDTSYLDFNYIGSFVNDLTYEIDYYQFTTVGVIVEVPNLEMVERFENLLIYGRAKLKREFQRRGFGESVLFFDEPIFKLSSDLPIWSTGSIRLYSVNFGRIDADESTVGVHTKEVLRNEKLLLNYLRFAMPTSEEIIGEINLEQIEAKLFINGNIDLRGSILMPYKSTDEQRIKIARNLEKTIQKWISESTGKSKKVIAVSFESLGTHPSDKFQFILWDKADESEVESILYEEKPDKITPPLLPTYRQSLKFPSQIDTNSFEFNHFWNNLILNAQAGNEISLLIETSMSNLRIDFEKGNQEFVNEFSEETSIWIKEKFLRETGNELTIIPKNLIHGPRFGFDHSDLFDYSQFNYVSFVPIVHLREDLVVQTPLPYMVNFDYFFNGIDTGAFGFQQFAKRLALMVLKFGYVELRIESSISKIPIDDKISNQYIAYSRLLESQKRLKQELALKLIDPNRIIFLDESAIVQGPIYDGSIPILSYREFHYLRIIPEKYLQNK